MTKLELMQQDLIEVADKTIGKRLRWLKDKRHILFFGPMRVKRLARMLESVKNALK